MSISTLGVVTYSPAVTLVPTYECFNRCTYCNFRQEPGVSPWLSLETAEQSLRALQGRGVSEILLLSGEVHPQSARRVDWWQRLYDLADLALGLGFLPHTNAGPLSLVEMERLGQVNVSMGLMVEQVTSRLLQTVHRYAPSKVPQKRLQQLEWAGQLGIPFTTGLLLGIGETEAEQIETLRAIAQVHQTWGHLQEVIVQPHSPGQTQGFEGEAFGGDRLVQVVAMAREILPEDVTIQVPPNLIAQPELLLACIAAGARDLGGIGPKDEVNPDYDHPQVQAIATLLTQAGWQLVPRLPVYPQYDDWLPGRLQKVVQDWREKL